VSVVRRDFRGFRLYLFVIVVFVCESSVGGRNGLRGFRLCLCLIVVFICDGSVRG
jgi:hypothetical protein